MHAGREESEADEEREVISEAVMGEDEGAVGAHARDAADGGDEAVQAAHQRVRRGIGGGWLGRSRLRLGGHSSTFFVSKKSRSLRLRVRDCRCRLGGSVVAGIVSADVDTGKLREATAGAERERRLARGSRTRASGGPSAVGVQSTGF